MKRLIEKIKERPIPVIVGLLVAITLFCILMIANGTEKKHLPMMGGGEERISFEDLMQDDNSGDFLFENDRNVERPMVPSRTQRFMDSIASANTGQQEDDPYQQENDPMMRKLQEQIEQMENSRVARSGTAQQDTGAERRKRLLEQRREYEKELEGERKRIHAQELERKSQREKRIEKETVPIKIRASIYNDHLVFPLDRVELMLDQDFIYKGKRFTKNSFLYATVTFRHNRVLFEINNIQQEPIKLWARDIQDGEMGMYVVQAGNFMEKYGAEMEGDAVGEGADQIGDAMEGRLIGNAIKGLGNFLKSKKFKEKDRVLLVNDDQVFLTNQ